MPNAELVTISNAPHTAVISTGLEDFYIKPSSVTLVQKVGRGDGTPGKLRDDVSGQEFESLVVVPLQIKRGRVCFPPGFSFDAEPICKSDDGIVPSVYVKTPQASRCGTCPNSQWVNKKRPPCDETARLLTIIRPTQDESDPNYALSSLPKIFNIRGASMSSLRDLMTQIKTDIVRLKSQNQAVNLFDYYVKLEGQKVERSGGAYYILKFSNLKRVKNTDEFGPFFQQYVAEARRHEEEVNSDQAVDNSVGGVVDGEFVDA